MGENYEGKLVNFTIEDNCYVNDNFLGTTVAKKITLNILNPNNEINLENKEIQAFMGINNEYVPFGNFIVEKPTNEEVKEIANFVGYDYMIKFNTKYTDKGAYPTTLGAFFQSLCSQVGLEAGNTDFINSDYVITGNPFTNNEDCRTVLSNIAQLAGGIAKIGRDNKVYIKSLDVDGDGLEELDGNNYFTDFQKNQEWGELNSLVLRISEVEGENTTMQDSSSIEQNGLTEMTITDNAFLPNENAREMVITQLWNGLKGLKYLPFKTKYYGYPYLDAGDKIVIKDNEENEFYSYILNHTITYNGGFDGDIETSAMTKTQTAYKNITTIGERFKRTEVIVDKQNQVIESVVSNVENQNNKIARVEQTVNSLNSKISDIADITTSQESNSGNLTFENINQSEPIHIEIRPLGEQISYLYPFDLLYPSDSLFIKLRTLRFINTDTNEIFDYELPDDLLYYDSEHYDSFVLDYDNQTIYINKKCKYNSSTGEVELLTSERIDEYTYPTIILTDGDYTVQMLKYDNTPYNCYLMARLMSQNIYTTQFATKAEMSSEINQSAQEISTKVSQEFETKSDATLKYSQITQTTDNIRTQVSKKVGNDEIISRINQSAEAVSINANKIDLSGKTINLTGDNIAIQSNNFNVDKYGNLTCSSASLRNASLTGGDLNFYDTDNRIVGKIQRATSTYNGTSAQALILSCLKSTTPTFFIQFNNSNGSLVEHPVLEIYQKANSYFDKYSSGTGYVHVVEVEGAIQPRVLSTDNIQPTSRSKNALISFSKGISVDGNVYANSFVNSSKESLKKNIKKCPENILEIVKNSEIYQFNYKTEEDTDKKHLGFIIGDLGGKYNTPEQVISQDKNGIDTYDMISMLWKAFQEYVEKTDKKIEELEKRLEER